MKIYNASANAKEMADSLNTDPKWGPSVSITPAGTNSIIVVAHPEDQIKIGQMILGSQDKATKNEMIDVGSLEASKVADRLTNMFGDQKTVQSLCRLPMAIATPSSCAAPPRLSMRPSRPLAS